jgi:hypothetical protein
MQFLVHQPEFLLESQTLKNAFPEQQSVGTAHIQANVTVTTQVSLLNKGE